MSASAATVRPCRRERGAARQERAPGEPRRIGYLYAAPALAFFIVFALLPLLHGLYLSFFDWDSLTSARWVGLANYQAAFEDETIRQSFTHAAVLIVFYAVLPIAIGLLLAGTIAHTKVRGLAAFRSVLFLPQVIPAVSIGVIWRLIYLPDDGTLNQGLEVIGLGGLARAWLGDFDTALPAVGVIGAWVEIGLCMVLFVSGVQRIPRNLYDAARVDGAGAIREFFAVTLPGLRPELIVATVLTVTAALQTFDLVYVTTSGGPGSATTVPAYYVYDLAFRQDRVGAAAAVGMVLALLLFLVSFAIVRFSERRR